MAIEIEYLCPLIQVFDMPTSVAFYRDLLGFELLETSSPREGDEFDWGLLRRGHCALMLNTAYERDRRPPLPDPGRFGGHDDTGLFFGSRDLDAVYAHLRRHGVEVSPPRVASYGMRQIWLKDPDGYGLCFQWPA